MPIVTITILIACVIFSLYAFSRPEIMEKYMFNAYAIKHFNQKYRFLSHAFIHSNYGHLIINMYVLYSFGPIIETLFAASFGKLGTLYYILLYTLSIYASSMVDYFKHKDNPNYNAVGASGAVSALVFCLILIMPTQWLLFPPMPLWLFGVLYLAYSFYMDRNKKDNVAHGAHAWGAIFGVLFLGILALIYGNNLFLNFWIQVSDSINSLF